MLVTLISYVIMLHSSIFLNFYMSNNVNAEARVGIRNFLEYASFMCHLNIQNVQFSGHYNNVAAGFTTKFLNGHSCQWTGSIPQ